MDMILFSVFDMLIHLQQKWQKYNARKWSKFIIVLKCALGVVTATKFFYLSFYARSPIEKFNIPKKSITS